MYIECRPTPPLVKNKKAVETFIITTLINLSIYNLSYLNWLYRMFISFVHSLQAYGCMYLLFCYDCFVMIVYFNFFFFKSASICKKNNYKSVLQAYLCYFYYLLFNRLRHPPVQWVVVVHLDGLLHGNRRRRRIIITPGSTG